ncbi:MAG: bifunctional (p)ppGpp synthetase/guanosine-3',5'-bis(diphosphate) 3'-pyrophosphohydrolase, partial [Proteobacteria bacterium]|nr:bifunctional (p)ppGpp synthetase/guanosine-3',5'-bis(diphosphate) 3'-pyrophosphohydrolase [Pseudomonadota bacterium]
LVRDVKQKREERKALIDESIGVLGDKLKSAGIKCEIHGRQKHFFSIYRKMVKKNKTLNEIYDLSAIRVLVDNICFMKDVSTHRRSYHRSQQRLRNWV